MRIGLVAPPWTPVPPPLYGGIELVVDELARGFQAAGHEVTLFTTGDSTCPVPRRWVLAAAEGTRIGMAVPELRHVLGAYAALDHCDLIHDHTVAGPLLAAIRAGAAPGRRPDRRPRRDHRARSLQRGAGRPVPGPRRPGTHHLHLRRPAPGRSPHPGGPGHPSRHRRLALPGGRRQGRWRRPLLPLPGTDGPGQGRPPGHRRGPQGRPAPADGGQDARTLGGPVLHREGRAVARAGRRLPG